MNSAYPLYLPASFPLKLHHIQGAFIHPMFLREFFFIVIDISRFKELHCSSVAVL